MSAKRTGLWSRVPFIGVQLLVVILAVGLLGLPAASTPSANAEGAVRTFIDPELRRQLATDPVGGVAAVVTTWSRPDLDAVEQLGVQGTRLFELPMILTQSLTLAQLEALEASPAVRSVFANRANQLLMEDTTWIVKARETWLPPEEGGLGITGENVHIAVIDTGADGLHEDMDNLAEFCETQQSALGAHPTVLCSPFNPSSGNAGPAGPTNDPRIDGTDDEGHGSHVSGTIAASGEASGGMEAPHSTIGIAPHARLHVYSANAGPALLDHEILSAYDDLIHKKRLGLSEVVAVSNSWGGGAGADYNPADPIHIAVESAYDVGILSVFAAGNDGPEYNTLSRQCVNPFVVCVAASTKTDSVVMFSSRGRPSELADTNRDGTVGGAGDVLPGNHDRRLGQTLGLGLYRPALTAPGVNINAISANSATCREGLGFDMGCYEPLNGTSMATPHVSGAVAIIVQAYRQGHGGATPSPGAIIDILERSANVSKLPGYEAEEQGAGRLDVRAAAEFALTYPNGLPPVNWGTATPPYAADQHPTAPATTYTEAGCTGDGSWSLQTDPIGQGRYGQHFIDVAESVDRLRVTVDWSNHPGANLYIRLWRPGVDPDAESEPAGPTRVFPDQEALGLLEFIVDRPFGTDRWLDVRSPEAGRWTLRVYHRAGGASDLCDPNSVESPKQTLGFNYTLTVEQPAVAQTPTAAITSPHEGDPLTGRFVEIEGSATYPDRWEGTTNWGVSGSGNPATMPEEDDRLLLHFQGNIEEGCTGDGLTDLTACDGPFLTENAELSSATAAAWRVPDPLFHQAAARSIVDPNWVWNLSGPTTLVGPMTVEFWASCGACTSTAGIDADWIVRLWGDGDNLLFEQRATAVPLLPNVPQKLSVTVDLPRVTASQQFVLHVDPVYIDSQVNTAIYYDSSLPCPGATSGPCDSIVRVPLEGGSSGPPGIPTNGRVTDVHDGLRVAWDAVVGASAYDVYRSEDPAFDLNAATPIATTSGTPCDSPSVPGWPSASRAGLCYTDSAVTVGRTYYYRVVAQRDSLTGKASLLASGTPTVYDRQVKVGFDRLYGPRVWEYATLLDAAATRWRAVWDTLELEPVTHVIAARAFTQGVGSANADVTPPPPPTGVRVTGGGKVPGEVPLAEGVKEASFGFVVQPGTDGPIGHLKVHDKETDVRIRAISFNSLTVDGNTCTITGQAEVRRGDTTRVESFAARCEDNGETGEEDGFRIQTDSYSGGGMLTGGNVRIHRD